MEKEIIEKNRNNASKYTFPLHQKDGREGYAFSSTMTFVAFSGCFFGLFAAHALDRDDDNLEKIGIIGSNGEFIALSKIAASIKVCRDRDLVVFRSDAIFGDGPVFFNLDIEAPEEELFPVFAWIGYPEKRSVPQIHNSKACPVDIRKEFMEMQDSGTIKAKHVKSLFIGVEQLPADDNEICGMFDNTNVDYVKEGYKSQGYSLKGMSGGALFKLLTPLNLPNCQFYFVGIGLEHSSRNKIVKGASRESVKNLIKELLVSEEIDY